MKILIKIGSALISDSGRINYQWLKSKVKEIAGLHNQGYRPIIVSSGAVAAGMEIENLTHRPKETLKLQLLAGEGQIRLMKHYKDLFMAHGIFVAQVLLTHHNFAEKAEIRTIKLIMNAYLEQGTIPIVNENDLVNKEEFEYKRVFTDNDILAGLVATLLKVDLAVILTDVDGLYLGDPKENRDARLIEEVESIDAGIIRMASKATNPLGLGGMSSKLKAAEMITGAGINTIVANGRYDISDILANRVKRTLFKGLKKEKNYETDNLKELRGAQPLGCGSHSRADIKI
ncbi:MAG TPA: glutamate 5-kinase [Spirochaetales bacterium]|nr:glutamate 5-kinase [Spirochaetales bacterium]